MLNRSDGRRELCAAGVFRRQAGSPRRFRHEIYAHIAEHESAAWNSYGDVEARRKLVAASTGGKASGAARSLVREWSTVFERVLDGLHLEHVRGSHDPERPNGTSTTDIAFKPV